MLLVAFTAVFNSVQNFVTTKLTQQVYSNVHGLLPAQDVVHTRLSLSQSLAYKHVRLPSGLSRPLPSACMRRTISPRSSASCWGIAEHALTVIYSVYDLALISYLIAFGHFASEILIFKSTGFNRGSISPVIVSSEQYCAHYFSFLITTLQLFL